MSGCEAALKRLRAACGAEPLSVAVSGGIDSMVLMHVLHRRAGRARARAFHAVSPAVPPLATARVKAHAEAAGWNLTILDAGEFADARYRANPVDRCYFCKLNLYGAVAARADGPVASGTNTDDLGDFRPGLAAAETWKVRHPYVEAGIDKATIYALAARLGLDDLAALPAQPCLASRVETGLAIEPAQMALIDAIETRLRDAFARHAFARDGRAPQALRARVTGRGVVVQVDEGLLADLPPLLAAAGIEDLCRQAGTVLAGTQAYRRGSAFLHGAP